MRLVSILRCPPGETVPACRFLPPTRIRSGCSSHPNASSFYSNFIHLETLSSQRTLHFIYALIKNLIWLKIESIVAFINNSFKYDWFGNIQIWTILLVAIPVVTASLIIIDQYGKINPEDTSSRRIRLDLNWLFVVGTLMAQSNNISFSNTRALISFSNINI